MTVVNKISNIVERMPRQKQDVLLALVELLVDDDFLTDEDLVDIKVSREEYARGEFVRHEDIDWD